MERGSLTVEAAFVIPVVLVVLMAVIEVVSVVGVQQELLAAAREGVRAAAVAPEPAVAVEAARNVLGDRPAVVSVTRPHVVGRSAEVVVRYDKPLITPVLRGITVPLSARAVMRVER